MGSDIDVSDVLEADPSDDVVAELVEDDVIPPLGPSGGDSRPASERDEQMLNVLEDIRDALRGGADGQ